MFSTLDVSRETSDRLGAFTALLERWGQTLNLVSRHDLGTSIQSRHIADSLSLVSHLPAGTTRLVDLGSGAGFPAIPIAIVTGCHVDLVESDGRKAAFLTTVLATLRLRGTVWPGRIEACRVASAGCLTARALAPLPKLLRYAHPLLLPGGTALFPKGRHVEEEIAAASQTWHMKADILPGWSQDARILKITGLEPKHDVLQE